MSGFSFGFSGDDIDIDDSDINVGEEGNVNSSLNNDDSLPELVEAKRHEMGEWLPALPSQISFNRLSINASQDGTKRSLTLARREVFDIRTQLMAEDSAGQDNEELIAGLEEGDIKPRFYEGGFKTWECALDLAKLVVNEQGGMGSSETSNEWDENRHVIELGAGTAIPSLALFAQLLSQPAPVESTTSQRKTHFTFADYNSAVLRLVTLPNLLLTWNNIVTRQTLAAPVDADADSTQKSLDQEEELDITPELLESFEKDLRQRSITVDFISGAWSPAFVDLVFSANGQGTSKTLILASETIYSPSALGIFSETLLALLRRSTTAKSKSRSLIAAKKVYFGVGGGVDEFLAVLRSIDQSVEVKQQLDVKYEGVGRVVLEIAEAGQ
ncbi:hypothetical protein ASPWEDRAFT_117361 [Aspergillus wentii DTO 134E9]|uniref:protein-histidine N-methyltransferase n=1 Tax=Aspergillus wentii DTO 134E9 TaxID=1073089 RepID=A0A1L9RAE6_ASPWE|nr:uncharacterized protein ASPWEDRAFT_117361 [Aspergillus wentii DTO 134E9]KAI9934432.1 hypothetical protein MW887_000046 [Aspergillus wentii]OJJ31843.1 hypothetical protein ASPWEDRAFT_117361 [Aspergillus wentii DTO 134E9]